MVIDHISSFSVGAAARRARSRSSTGWG